MRKNAMSMDEVKKSVESLQGCFLKISVNRGRKRIIKYEGEIENLYPQVFTLKIVNNKNIEKLSFSYSDVICGDVKMTAK